MSACTYTTKTTDRWGNGAESSEQDWNWVLRGMLCSMANEYTTEVVVQVGTETMLRYMRDADGNWHNNL
jgi:hypothetical protein